MGNENGQTPEALGDEQVVLDRLRKIEEGINEISELRKRRSLVTAIGLVLVILIIGVFLINLYNYASNFPVDELAVEVQKNTVHLGHSEEVSDLVKVVQTKVYPALKSEITERFEAEIPKFQEEVLQSADSLKKFLNKEIKTKILEEMANSLAMLEKELLSRYPDITPNQMEAAIKEAEVEFIESLTACIEKRLNIVLNDVLVLNESFEHLKKDKAFKNLKPEMIEEIKAGLIESLLELAIYHVNPNRGKMSALTVGLIDPAIQKALSGKTAAPKKEIEAPAKAKPAAIKKGGAK